MHVPAHRLNLLPAPRREASTRSEGPPGEPEAGLRRASGIACGVFVERARGDVAGTAPGDRSGGSSRWEPRRSARPPPRRWERLDLEAPARAATRDRKRLVLAHLLVVRIREGGVAAVAKRLPGHPGARTGQGEGCAMEHGVARYRVWSSAEPISGWRHLATGFLRSLGHIRGHCGMNPGVLSSCQGTVVMGSARSARSLAVKPVPTAKSATSMSS